MNAAFRPVLLAAAVLLLMLGFNAWRKATLRPDTTPWRKDLQAAKQEAAQTNKPVLAYFTAEWCGPCQVMRRETWPDPRAAEALRSVVPVKIDIDKEPEAMMAFNVSAVPRLQLIHPDGTPGAVYEGFISPDELVGWLKSR